MKTPLVEFTRQTRRGSAAQAWLEKSLPTCPPCKTDALWETETKVDQLAMDRWHFRCPSCNAVLSMPTDFVVSDRVPPVTVVKKAIAKNLRIESAGRRAQGMVGMEYPLAELQQWAREKDN